MARTPSLRGERFAGALLWRGGPAAAFAVTAVALAGAVLVPIHLWTPVVVLPVLLVLGAVGWRLLGLVPVRPAPVWSASLTLALATAAGVWAAATRAEQVVLRRDSGTYALYAQWIATRHGLPVEPHLDAFGGAAALGVPGVTLASPGFFEAGAHGGSVLVPQFLVGAPALYSLGWWAGGWAGLLVVPAIVGALALLAVGGLTARVVGPRWAPLAVAALGLTQPVLHAARTTWSEAPALLLVVAAMALAVDAVETDRVGVARLAGALAGLAGIVRIDAMREVALLVGVCALLVLRRSRVAVPMAVAALVTTLLAAVPALWFSRPYLDLNRGSILPLVAGTVVVVLLFALAVVVARSRDPRAEAVLAAPAAVLAEVGAPGSPGAPGVAGPAADAPPSTPAPVPAGADVRRGRMLPLAVGALVALVGLALATRPWWQVAHQAAPPGVLRGLTDLQAQQHLAVDGTRTYAEQTVGWVAWYTGPVALLLAWATLTVLAARAALWWQASRAVPSRPPGWLVPAAVGLGSTVLVLYRPGITPDHPWADRRLVTVVLPTVAVAAVAAVAWAVRTLRRRAPAPLFPLAAVVGVAALLVPAAAATAPVRGVATERGEPAAVAALCASLEPQDVVVAVSGGDEDGGEDRTTNEWPQVVRGVCGHPALSLVTDDPGERRAALDRLDALARGTGHRLVVLGASDGDGSPPQHLLDLGLQPRRVVRLETTEDPHLLDGPMTGGAHLLVEVWTAPWSAPSGA